MDLLRVFAVLRKRKQFVVFGVITGLISAFLALYTVKLADGQPTFSRRHQATYETKFKLILDEPGFGIGQAERENASAHWARVARDKDLAAIYSKLITSDEFISRMVPGIKTAGASIEATCPEKLPIVEVAISGNDSELVKGLAKATSAGFVSYIAGQQKTNKIAVQDRIEVHTVSSPSEPTALPTHDKDLAVAMFGLSLLVFVYLALAVENITEKLANRKSSGVSELIPRASKG